MKLTVHNGRDYYGLLVSGRRRLVRREWYDPLEGAKPPEYFESNGCSYSPDWLRGYLLWPACHLHDWAYDCGGDWAARRQADAELYRNLLALLLEQGASRWLAYRVAWVYWGRVRLWGARPFTWADGAKPLSRWRRFREAWGLFRSQP